MRQNTKSNLLKLTQMGMLAALSLVLVQLVRFPIFPAAPFLEYDMADVPILIGTLLFGVPSGLGLLTVVSVVQAFLMGGNGWVGMVMHILASGVLLVTANVIYHRGKNAKSLFLGLLAGTLAMTLFMIPLNFIFTVHFFGVPMQAMKDMMLPAVLPFNFIKAAANSVLTAMVFVPLRKVAAVSVGRSV